LVDATRDAVLFDAVTGGSAIGTGSLAIGRAEDQSANSRHLVQAVTNLRPLSIRTPVVGLRNRLAVSAPVAAQYAPKGGAMNDDSGFAGARQSVHVPENGTSIYGYFNAGLPASAAGTFSVFVLMEDTLPPAFGAGSSTNAANSFVLRVNSSNADPLTYGVTDLGGGVYRISVPVTGAGISSFGFIRYSSNQQRGFSITGYQLETGTMSAYQHVTNGGLDVVEAGAAHLVWLSFDGVDDTLSASFPEGLVGEAFVAGRGACHAFPVTVDPAGSFACGPLGFSGSAANALLTVSGNGAVPGAMLMGVILRSGTFNAGERTRLATYFIAHGAGPYLETL
jgi:hypothetical protein